MKPCHASCAHECTRNPIRILFISRRGPQCGGFLFKDGRKRLTNAVGTWVLAVALCTQLVALITSTADTAADGAGRTTTTCRSVRVLAMLHLLAVWASKVRVAVRVVDTDVLLQLLQGVVRALGEGVHAGCMHVSGRDMAVGEQRRGGDGVVGRKAVERVGQHGEDVICDV